MDLYDRALRARVRPGDVVLDLGCGTGILAIHAARCGAARVHAVESMPVARIARELVAAAGVAGRVIVHERDAAEMEPVEPVDVVVSDFMGRFVIDDAMLDAVAAAGRWLKPGGVFVPERVKLLVAPVGSFGMAALDWVDSTVLGIDLRVLRPYVMNASYGVELRPELLLAPVAVCSEMAPPAPPALEARLSFTVEKAGRLRGLCGWFEATLAPGIALSTAPGVTTHWGQTLLPVPLVDVLPGVELAARVRFVEEDSWEYEWEVELRRGGVLLLDVHHDTRDRPGDRHAPPLPVPPAGPVSLNERGAESYASGRVAEAVWYWEHATRALDPRDPTWASPIFENLGIGYLQTERPVPAARAFLRALDGDLSSREQSLRLLLVALRAAGHADEAARLEASLEKA